MLYVLLDLPSGLVADVGGFFLPEGPRVDLGGVELA